MIERRFGRGAIAAAALCALASCGNVDAPPDGGTGGRGGGAGAAGGSSVAGSGGVGAGGIGGKGGAAGSGLAGAAGHGQAGAGAGMAGAGGHGAAGAGDGTAGAGGHGAVGAGGGAAGAGGGQAGAGGGVAGAGGGAAGTGGQGAAGGGGGAAGMGGTAGASATFCVVRVGDGTSAFSGASVPVFIETRRTDGSLVGTVSLPTAASGANQPFSIAGTATSEGALTLSPSGHTVAVAGYATAPGTTNVSSTTSAAVPRSVALVDAAGNVDTSSTFATAESGGNPRAAVTVDGGGIWLAGSAGLWYGVAGTAAQSGTALLAAPSNVRWVAIFGGQLYATSGSGIYTNVFSVGTGLPTTAGQTATSLPGLPTSGASPYGFVLFDLDAAVAGYDTLYLADDSAGLQKWIFDGAVWTLGETLNLPTPVGFRGVAAFASGGQVTLMASTAETGSNRLVVFVDDGGAAPVGTPVATSSANTMFRGVALSPHL